MAEGQRLAECPRHHIRGSLTPGLVELLSVWLRAAGRWLSCGRQSPSFRPAAELDWKRMTAILGISAFYHDSAAALVVDGRIVAAAQEERFTRNQARRQFPDQAIEYCLEEAGLDAGATRLRRLLRQAAAEVRAAAWRPIWPSRRRGSARFVIAMPVWLGQKLHLPREIRKGLRRPLPAPLRLHRTPRVARRQRLLPLAVRRGGHPHARRRRRMGHRQLRLRPRQPHRGLPRAPLSPFARAALFGLHLLLRLPRQLGRVQADGPGPVWRADVCRPDPRETHRSEGRRLVPHGHVVLPLLPGAGDDLAEVRPALRRAAAAARGPADRSGKWTWPPRSSR